MLSDTECTAVDVTGFEKQSLVRLGHFPDDDNFQQQQMQSVTCEDCSWCDDHETRPNTTQPASQGAQPPPLTEYPAALKRSNSEHQGAAFHSA